jgi:hypothetical protein
MPNDTNVLISQVVNTESYNNVPGRGDLQWYAVHTEFN